MSDDDFSSSNAGSAVRFGSFKSNGNVSGYFQEDPVCQIPRQIPSFRDPIEDKQQSDEKFLMNIIKLPRYQNTDELSTREQTN